MAGADLLSERFKKMLPPNLQDNEGDQPIPPQAQAQMQQLQQHAQALNAACQHYEQQIQQLQMEKQAKVVDNQSRMAIEKMKIEAQVAVAEISTKAQSLNERIAFVEDLAKQFHAQAHDVAMQAQGAQHAQAAQAQQADAQAQQSAQEAAQSQQAQQQQQAAQPAQDSQ
jgi:delta 1-pyrroline-5-carboxylate dehydrogenase